MAWIGDSAAMIASWNKHDSTEIFTTPAHVPEMSKERERIEKCGSDVREVAEGSYRIFLKGENIPGLTMSRALGDFMLSSHNRGVSLFCFFSCLSLLVLLIYLLKLK